MDDKRTTLYNNLIQSGLVDASEIGADADEFKKYIKDEKSAREFYRNLMATGRFKNELGTADDFYNSISPDFLTPADSPLVMEQPEQGAAAAGTQPQPQQTAGQPQQTTTEVAAGAQGEQVAAATMQPQGVAAQRPQQGAAAQQPTSQLVAAMEEQKGNTWTPKMDVQIPLRPGEKPEKEPQQQWQPSSPMLSYWNENNPFGVRGFAERGMDMLKNITDDDRAKVFGAMMTEADKMWNSGVKAEVDKAIAENKEDVKNTLRGKDPSSAATYVGKYGTSAAAFIPSTAAGLQRGQAVAEASDPQKVIDKVTKYLDEQDKKRAQEGEGTGAPDEGAAFLRNQLMKRVYNYLVEKKMPQSSVEYILRSMFDSTTGTIYKLLLKKSDTAKQIEQEAMQKYDASGLEQVGAEAAKIVADLPLMAATGGIGGAAGKATTELATRGVIGRLIGEGVTREAAEAIATRAVQQTGMKYGIRMASEAANFASLEGIGSAATQMYNEGTISPWKLVMDTAKGGLTGATMGVFGGANETVQRYMERNLGSGIGKTLGYSTSLGGRTAILVGSSVLGQYVNNPDFDIRDVDWTEEVVHAGLMNMGFDVIGAVKRFNAQRGKPKFDATDVNLTKEEIRQLNSAGIEGGNAMEISESILKRTDSGHAEKLEGGDTEVVNSGGILADLLENPNVDQQTKMKVTYLMTGKVYRMSPSTSVSEVEANEDGTFRVETFNSAGQTNELRQFKTEKEAEAYRKRAENSTKHNQVETLETMMGDASKMSNATRVFDLVARQYGLTREQIVTIFSDGRNGKFAELEDKGGFTMPGVGYHVGKQIYETLEAVIKNTKLGNDFYYGIDRLKRNIDEGYGQKEGWIDKVLKKDYNDMWGTEKRAVDDYISNMQERLKGQKASEREAAARGLLEGRVAEGTPTDGAPEGGAGGEGGAPTSEAAGGERAEGGEANGAPTGEATGGATGAAAGGAATGQTAAAGGAANGEVPAWQSAAERGKEIYQRHDPQEMYRQKMKSAIAGQRLTEAGMSQEERDGLLKLSDDALKERLDGMTPEMRRLAEDYVEQARMTKGMENALDETHVGEVNAAKEMVKKMDPTGSGQVTVVQLGRFGSRDQKFGIVIGGLNADGTPKDPEGRVVVVPLIGEYPTFSTFNEENVMTMKLGRNELMSMSTFADGDVASYMLPEYENDAATLTSPVRVGQSFDAMVVANDPSSRIKINILSMANDGKAYVVQEDGKPTQEVIDRETVESMVRNATNYDISQEYAEADSKYAEEQKAAEEVRIAQEKQAAEEAKKQAEAEAKRAEEEREAQQKAYQRGYDEATGEWGRSLSDEELETQIERHRAMGERLSNFRRGGLDGLLKEKERREEERRQQAETQAGADGETVQTGGEAVQTNAEAQAGDAGQGVPGPDHDTTNWNWQPGDVWVPQHVDGTYVDANGNVKPKVIAGHWRTSEVTRNQKVEEYLAGEIGAESIHNPYTAFADGGSILFASRDGRMGVNRRANNSAEAKRARLTLMSLAEASKSLKDLYERLQHVGLAEHGFLTDFGEYVARYKGGLISKEELAYAVGFTKEEAAQRYGSQSNGGGEAAVQANGKASAIGKLVKYPEGHPQAGRPDYESSKPEDVKDYLTETFGGAQQAKDAVAGKLKELKKRFNTQRDRLAAIEDNINESDFDEEEAAKSQEFLQQQREALAAIQKSIDYWKRVNKTIKLPGAAPKPKSKKRKPTMSPEYTQAQKEYAGNDAAMEILGNLEPQTAVEVAAEFLSDPNVMLLRDEFLKETGYGAGEAKRFAFKFASKEKGGISLRKAGEKLMLWDKENGYNLLDQNDPMAGVNAILEAFHWAQKPSDLSRMIERNRVEQARELFEHDNDEESRYDEEQRDRMLTEQDAEESILEEQAKIYNEYENSEEYLENYANFERTKEKDYERIGTVGGADLGESQTDSQREDGGGSQGLQAVQPTGSTDERGGTAEAGTEEVLRGGAQEGAQTGAGIHDDSGVLAGDQGVRPDEGSTREGDGSEAKGGSQKTEQPVKGLEEYSRDEIKDIVSDHISQVLENSEIGVTIKGMEIHGSRNRGDSRANSDLDIVVEYEGDFKEASLFNVLNEEPLEIDGVKVDINPIRKEESGTLESYMEKSRQYDEEKRRRQEEPSTNIMEAGKGIMSNLADALGLPFEEVADMSGRKIQELLDSMDQEGKDARGAAYSYVEAEFVAQIADGLAVDKIKPEDVDISEIKWDGGRATAVIATPRGKMRFVFDAEKLKIVSSEVITPGKRKGAIFNLKPKTEEEKEAERAAYEAAETKKKYDEERAKFADVNPQTNYYADILQKNDNVADAVKALRQRAADARAQAEDWASRVYKENKTVVEGVNKGSAADDYKTTIGAANERRRTAMVEGLRAEAEEAEKLADTLIKRTGYKEEQPEVKDKELKEADEDTLELLAEDFEEMLGETPNDEHLKEQLEDILKEISIRDAKAGRESREERMRVRDKNLGDAIRRGTAAGKRFIKDGYVAPMVRDLMEKICPQAVEGGITAMPLSKMRDLIEELRKRAADVTDKWNAAEQMQQGLLSGYADALENYIDSRRGMDWANTAGFSNITFSPDDPAAVYPAKLAKGERDKYVDTWNKLFAKGEAKPKHIKHGYTTSLVNLPYETKQNREAFDTLYNLMDGSGQALGREQLGSIGKEPYYGPNPTVNFYDPETNAVYEVAVVHVDRQGRNKRLLVMKLEYDKLPTTETRKGEAEEKPKASIEETNKRRMEDIEEKLTDNENKITQLQEELEGLQPEDEAKRGDLETQIVELQAEQRDLEAEYGGLRQMQEESKALAQAEKEGLDIVEEASMPYITKRQKELKSAHDGALVLFRNGDFYACYGEDAAAASKVLGTNPTKRGKTPMVLFPSSKLDEYLPKLIKADMRVAITDEVEEKREAKRAPKRRKESGLFTGDLFTDSPVTEVVPTTDGGAMEFSSFGGLDSESGEFAYVERRFTKSGEFSFTGSEKIEHADDVAYIFRSLENKSIENVFVVLVKDGKPTVVHIGMGSPTASYADVSAIRMAAQKMGGVDRVYMVHNHPSGNLVASSQDFNLLGTIYEMFDDGVVQPGIIIDTTSGKYGIFGVDGGAPEVRTRPKEGGDIPLPVLRFDEQVFAPGFDLSTLSRIRSAEDVAALVSSQRLGDCSKLSFLVLSQSSNVVANIHTTYGDLTKDNIEVLAKQMADDAVRFVGSRVIVYGNFESTPESIKRLNARISELSGKAVKLLDLIRMRGSDYSSAMDYGLLDEPEAKYGPQGVAEPSSEEVEIAERAKKDGTYMKAPNGKPSKLNEAQWVQVRTKAFKDWFGDWELPNKMVGIVSGAAEHGFKDFREAKKWAKENIARTYNNDETGGKGNISISNRAIDKFLSESSVSKSDDKDIHLTVLRVLPDVIKESIEAETHPDYKKVDGKRSPENGINENVIMHRLYGAVNVDGDIYRVKITLKRDVNSSSQSKAYSYEETKIELLAGHHGKSADFPRYSSNSISAAKLLKDVDKSYKEGEKILINSKFLDENGEPLAEYIGTNGDLNDDIRFSIRKGDAPKKTGIGYKVFALKEGKLYPPMVANPGGKDTPVGVWLNADAAPVVGMSKTGRPKVKAGGKGTQGGSGTLAYRPGWHLGEIPYALQFNRVNPETGERELFPNNFVWAEVEYANDVDYQNEAMSYGMNPSGKFQHSLAGLPKVPENGSYRYRTNPNPETDPWIITGAMRVNKILTPTEVDAMVKEAGRKPQPRQEGYVTDEQVNALNDQMVRGRFIGERGAARLDRAEEVTTRLSNLDVARTMERSGKDAESIKLATGWEKGADGKWRYEQADFKLKEGEDFYGLREKAYNEYMEAKRAHDNIYKELNRIDDAIDKYPRRGRTEAQRAAVAELNKKRNAVAKQLSEASDAEYEKSREYDASKMAKAKLSDWIEDEELFKAYPELADVPIEVKYMTSRGAYTPSLRSGAIGKIEMSNDMPSAQFRSTLVHEIQHAIQDIEGFASGGNARMVEDARFNVGWGLEGLYSDMLSLGMGDWLREHPTENKLEAIREFAKTLPEEERESTERAIERLDKMMEEFGPYLGREEESAVDVYKRFSGEVEARNAANRIGLSPENRQRVLAEATEDVAREDQIFIMNAVGNDNELLSLPAEENLQALNGEIDRIQAMTVNAPRGVVAMTAKDILEAHPEIDPVLLAKLIEAGKNPDALAVYVPQIEEIVMFPKHGSVGEISTAKWHESFHSGFDKVFKNKSFKDREKIAKAAEQVARIDGELSDWIDRTYKTNSEEEKIVHMMEQVISQMQEDGTIGKLRNGISFGDEYTELNEIANDILKQILGGLDDGKEKTVYHNTRDAREDASGHPTQNRRGQNEADPSALRRGQGGDSTDTGRTGGAGGVQSEAEGGDGGHKEGSEEIRYSLKKPQRREGESLGAFAKRVKAYEERLAEEKASRRVEKWDEENKSDEELNSLSMEMMSHPSPTRREGESETDFNIRKAEWEKWDAERRPEIEKRMEEIRVESLKERVTERDKEIDEADSLYRGKAPSKEAPEGFEPDAADGVNNLTKDEMREVRQDAEMRLHDIQILTSKKQAKRDIRYEIIERRRYIETGNLEDAFFVDDLKKVAGSQQVLKDIPAYLEGTYEGKPSEELVKAAQMVKDWFEECYNLMAQEGVLYGAPQIQNYVTHIWDWGRSPKESQERFNTYVNAMRLRSPFTRHRVIPSYAEGVAMGMVPKYEDITGIITEYGHYVTETIANKRMINFLRNFKMDIPGGEDNMPMTVDVVVTDDVRDPIYSRMNHTAWEGYKVLNIIKPMIAPVFGDQHILDHTQLNTLTNKLVSGIWVTSSLMKKINLSFSFFHHGALTETAIAMLGPARAAKVIAKNLIWDVITKGEIPAMNDKEATRDAVKHLVSLGATNDYSTADVQNFTTMIYNLTKDKNIQVAKQAAYVLDMLNKGMDKVLWDVIHDGYKIASFAKMAKEIREKGERSGWSSLQIENALDEAGHLVNDTFGGLHFDILGYSPKSVRIMRALLLSPDWTLATVRQALSPFGYGRLYNDDGVWNAMFKGEPSSKTRRKYGRQFWLMAAVFFYGIMNGLNRYFRSSDEEEEKRKADEMRKVDPEYKSPYELAYPEGMKWYDYTMLGNTLGHQTHLFTGRYSDGTETYLRWGKQFREVPELFFGRDGLSFPGPMIDKMAGKANPLMSTAFEFVSGHSLSGWENQDMKDKKGVERDVARLYMLTKKFLPYSIPTQEDKDFLFMDLLMPSSKGFTPGKAINYFDKAIKSGDTSFVANVYKACVMNGLNPEKLFDVAKAKIEAETKQNQLKDVETVDDAQRLFNETQDIKERKRLKRYIEQQLGAQDYHAISQAEMVERAKEVINGEEQVTTKADDRYVGLSTSEDVMEDYRLSKTLAGLKRYNDSFTALQQTDPAAAQRMAEEKRKFLEGYEITSKARSAITRLKRELGKPGVDGQEVMDEIRQTRADWRSAMDDIDKR